MKKNFLTLLAFVLFCGTVFAQEVQYPQKTDVRWRLFSTQDSNIFLQLDTLNGSVYTLNTTNGSLTEIVELPSGSSSFEKGAYTLYATKDKYNFVLIDQDTAASWLIHWDYNKDKCSCKKLSSEITEHLW